MSDLHDAVTHFEPEYPTNTVVAVFEEPQQAQDAVSALEGTSVDTDSVEVVCNRLAEEKFQELEDENPLKSRVADFLFKAGEEREELRQYDRWLSEGHFVVQVPVDDDERAREVADILQQHGGHYIHHFSEFTVAKMAP
jgi:hypothetical protein